MHPALSTLLLSTGWASSGAEFVVWRKEPLWRSVDRDEAAPDGGSLETLRTDAPAQLPERAFRRLRCHIIDPA